MVRTGREDEGFAILEEAAGAGDPIAQGLLAFSIEDSGSSERNGRSAQALYESASEANDPHAIAQLADKAAARGDYDRAVALAERAAISGQPQTIAFRDTVKAQKEAEDRRQAQLREAAAAFARQESAPGGVRIPANATYAQRSCRKTGFGPGNSVTCGPYADRCEKTGFGPGNDVACGGLATRCEKTGFGPGNDVACGGLSTRCEKTGFGEGNRVSCGGLATRCEKTGFGPGNRPGGGGLGRGPGRMEPDVSGGRSHDRTRKRMVRGARP